MNESTTTGRRPGLNPLTAMLLSMAVVEAVSGITQSYFFPLLPALGLRAGIGTADQNWIYVIQTISMAVLTPILARLGDMYGCRRLLRISVAMVTAGSLIMALAPNLTGLTIGAALQGGVVAFMPLLIGILRSVADDQERVRRGIGILVSVLLIAVGAGGVISGAIGDGNATLGLWVGVLVGALGLAACLLLPKGGDPERGQTFDTVGLLLLTAGLIGTTLAVAQGPAWGWTSVATLVWGGLGIAAMVAWGLLSGRAAQPIVAVRLFADRRISLVSVVNFCMSFSTIGTLTVTVTFLAADHGRNGYGFGLSSGTIGWVTMLWVGVGFVSSNLTARALGRVDDRQVVAAAGLTSLVGFGGLAFAHGSLGSVLAFIVVNGLAVGVYQTSTRALIVEAVPERETAMAAGVNELVLSYGAAVGAAVVGAVFAANPAGADGAVTGTAYTTIWAVCAALGVVAAVAALGLRARPSQPDAAVTAPTGLTV